MSKREKGQSLVEIIIALALASLVAVGLVRVTTTSIRSVRYSSDQSRMTALAQRKITEIIDYKNSNPSDFWDGFPVFPDEENAAEGYCLHSEISQAELPTETPDYSEAMMAKINVKVFWDEKGSGTQCGGKNYNHSLNFDTYVTN